jgi:hypothetical protein
MLFDRMLTDDDSQNDDFVPIVVERLKSTSGACRFNLWSVCLVLSGSHHGRHIDFRRWRNRGISLAQRARACVRELTIERQLYKMRNQLIFISGTVPGSEKIWRDHSVQNYYYFRHKCMNGMMARHVRIHKLQPSNTLP